MRSTQNCNTYYSYLTTGELWIILRVHNIAIVLFYYYTTYSYIPFFDSYCTSNTNGVLEGGRKKKILNKLVCLFTAYSIPHLELLAIADAWLYTYNIADNS